MSGFVSIDVGGLDMRMLVGEPKAAGPHPAILLAYHREGFSSFTEHVVARFADAGYVISVPDLYHRSGDATWQVAVKQRRDDQVLADMAAALAFLKNRPDVDAARIAIAGHCMGGRISLLVASSMSGEFNACLSYYGGGMAVPWGDSRPPFELLAGISCPVAAFFGNDDTNPSPKDADRLEAELERVGADKEFHRFDGAGHSYMSPDSSDYREVPAKESWRLTFDFLSRHLQS